MGREKVDKREVKSEKGERKDPSSTCSTNYFTPVIVLHSGK